jgi:hypothetical protein
MVEPRMRTFHPYSFGLALLVIAITALLEWLF